MPPAKFWNRKTSSTPAHSPAAEREPTRRRHDRQRRLNVARDRNAHRLKRRQAAARLELSSLGYCLTSNHAHLRARADNRKRRSGRLYATSRFRAPKQSARVSISDNEDHFLLRLNYFLRSDPAPRFLASSGMAIASVHLWEIPSKQWLPPCGDTSRE